jgi:hypothetical protein
MSVTFVRCPALTCTNISLSDAAAIVLHRFYENFNKKRRRLILQTGKMSLLILVKTTANFLNQLISAYVAQFEINHL